MKSFIKKLPSCCRRSIYVFWPGLPVITVKDTPSGDIVKKYNCGAEVEYSVASTTEVIKKLFGDQNIFDEFPKNAIKAAKEYNWTLLFHDYMKLINERTKN